MSILNAKYDSQALLIFAKYFLEKGGFTESNLQDSGVLKVKGSYQPSGFISQLTKPKKTRNITKNFFNLPNHKLSALVPEVRLYKVHKSGRYQPFYFPTDTKVETQILNRPFGLSSAGIKTFDVSFVGQDTFTAKRFLDCKLTIYVDSLEYIFKEPPPGDWAVLADLFTISRAKLNKTLQAKPSQKKIPSSEVFNAAKFEIGAVIGWAGGESVLTSAEISDIEETKLALRMTLSDHTINVNQDGSATIDISYTARVSTVLSSTFFDIVASPKALSIAAGALDEDIKEAQGIADAQVRAAALKQIRTAKRSQYYRTLSEGIIRPLRKAGKIHTIIGNDFFKDYYSASQKAADLDLAEGIDDPSVKKAAKKAVQKGPASVPTKGKRGTSGRLAQIRNPAVQPISYINYGDFLEQIFKYAKKNIQDSIKSLKAKKPEPSDLDKKIKTLQGKLTEINQTKVLLTDVLLTLKDDNTSTTNVADIPISMKTIEVFFFQELANKRKHSFTLKDALHLSVTKILPRALSKFTAGAATFLESGVNLSYISISGQKLKAKGSEIDISKLPSFLKRKTLKHKKEEMEYFIIYSPPSKSSGYLGAGIPAQDMINGIFHFNLSKDRGLIKKIDFKKFDVQYRREGLMVNSVSLYDELKMPYSATITMVGNTLFFPGSQIFIDPTTIGFGDPRAYNSAAFRIGLGGYYTVLSVNHSFNGPEYTTTLDCSFGSWKEDRGGGMLAQVTAEGLGIVPGEKTRRI